MLTVIDAKEARYEYIEVAESCSLRSCSKRLSLRGLEQYFLAELVDAYIGGNKTGNVKRIFLVGPDKNLDAYYGEREFELWQAN